MKISKILNDIVEAKVHYYGVDAETEKRAASPMFQTMPWKNGKALKTTIKKYLTSDILRTLGRVTIKSGSSQYITFNIKNYNINEVIELFTPPLQRFCKMENIKILFTDIKDSQFSLNIIRTTSQFTDNVGRKITPNRKFLIEK